jgi:hypothetical protein
MLMEILKGDSFFKQVKGSMKFQKRFPGVALVIPQSMIEVKKNTLIDTAICPVA